MYSYTYMHHENYTIYIHFFTNLNSKNVVLEIFLYHFFIASAKKGSRKGPKKKAAIAKQQ